MALCGSQQESLTRQGCSHGEPEWKGSPVRSAQSGAKTPTVPWCLEMLLRTGGHSGLHSLDPARPFSPQAGVGRGTSQKPGELSHPGQGRGDTEQGLDTSGRQ